MKSSNNNKNTNKSNPKNAKKPNPMALKALEHLKHVKEEEDRIRAIQEEEERKIKEEEERVAAAAKAIEDEKIRKKEAKQAKILAQKEAGTYKTKGQKLKEKRLEGLRSRPISTISTTYHSEESNEINTEIIPTVQFRSPITCIMGHVDTGKTKIMDKLRNTNVQEGEVGGITQQIGATFIPKIDIMIKMNNIKEISIPGLLMIDTPGHESFSNLRKRGSSFADIVILVIDIVHGLEPQTIESLEILKETNTKFIIALNKVDRLYGWNSIPNNFIQNSLQHNENLCIHEFNDRLFNIQGQLKEQGINAELYWKNNSIEDTISICPLSAITGEGIPDLLDMIVTISETNLTDQISIKEELKCIVMEKTAVDGIGITVDALLISGTLNIGTSILIGTSNGLIKTQIRNLLTPPPKCESRVTTKYNKNSSLTGAIGFKLVASNLENIILGSDIIINTNNTEITDINEEDLIFSSSINETIPQYNFQENGVIVYAPSEGSLEALIHHLKVPISAAYIGKVMKIHITKMTVSNKTDYKEINTVLAFDVDVDEQAQILADSNNITILRDQTIYRLFNQYDNFKLSCINQRKDMHRHLIVYPCILNILKDKIFNKKGPFIFGVKVIKGNLHVNTPLVVINGNNKLIIGRVTSIQRNGNNIQIAETNSEVCIKIENEEQTNYAYGRHFDHNNEIVSHVTRNSITVMKEHFKDEITTDDGKLNNNGKLLKYLSSVVLA
jgi:translation initiation factor aIF-2/yIF-2